jgi:hypothetical protein
MRELLKEQSAGSLTAQTGLISSAASRDSGAAAVLAAAVYDSRITNNAARSALLPIMANYVNVRR